MKRIIRLDEQNNSYINNIGFEASGMGIVNYSQWPIYVRLGALDTPTSVSASIIVPPGNSINIPVTGSNFSFLMDVSTGSIQTASAIQEAYIILYDNTEIPPSFGPAPSFNFGETRVSETEAVELNSGNNYTQEITIDTASAKTLNLYLVTNSISGGPPATVNAAYGRISVEYVGTGGGFTAGLFNTATNGNARTFSIPVLSQFVNIKLQSHGVNMNGVLSYTLSGDTPGDIVSRYPSGITSEAFSDTIGSGFLNVTLSDINNYAPEPSNWYISQFMVNIPQTTSDNDVRVFVVQGFSFDLVFEVFSSASHAVSFQLSLPVHVGNVTLVRVAGDNNDAVSHDVSGYITVDVYNSVVAYNPY